MLISDDADSFWGNSATSLLVIPALLSPAVLLGPWIGGSILFWGGGFAGKARSQYPSRGNRDRFPVIPLILLLGNAALLWSALPALISRTGVFENVSPAELILALEILPFSVIPCFLGSLFSLPPIGHFRWACPFLYLAGYCLARLWLLPGPRPTAYRAAALLPLILGGFIAIEGREFYEKRLAELERRAALQAEIDARPPPFELGLYRNAYSSEPANLKNASSFIVQAPPVPVLVGSDPLRHMAMSIARACIKLPDGGNSNLFAMPGSSSDSPVHLLLGTVNMQADIVLVAGEDANDARLAREKGKDLIATTIGHDALVFFTPADNPVNSITPEQARAVYSGTITNWKELGGNNEPIKAFQHSESGYQQNRALRSFMAETSVREPEKHVYVMIDSAGFRSEWTDAAGYDNTPGALGYALRVSLMHPDTLPGIKVLSLNGVAPTPENIRNGTYPAVLPILAVTLRESAARPEVQRYIQWMQGPQGRELIERCGVIGVVPSTERKS